MFVYLNLQSSKLGMLFSESYQPKNTYLDFDLDRDRDSECLEALDGLRVPDLLSDFTRAGLPAGDFDWERDS